MEGEPRRAALPAEEVAIELPVAPRGGATGILGVAQGGAVPTALSWSRPRPSLRPLSCSGGAAPAVILVVSTPSSEASAREGGDAVTLALVNSEGGGIAAIW